MHPIRRILAFALSLPTVTPEDGKRFVLINDAWMPL